MNLSYQCLYKFVGNYRLLLDKIEQEKCAAIQLAEKKLNRLALDSTQKMEQLLEDRLLRNEEFYREKFDMEAIRFELSGTEQRTSENNLPEIFSNLSAFFILTTLRYACVALSHSNISDREYDIPFLEEVLAQAKSRKDIPTIQIYYYAFLTLREFGREDLIALKEYFFEYQKLLNPKEQKDVLLMAVNACIRRLNTGEREFAREAFLLYRHGLTHQILLNDVEISRFDYKNIVSIALMLEEYDWVEDFIGKYTPLLSPEFRDSYSEFSTARLHFARGRYREAMKLINQIEYDDMFFNLSAKMMQLKILYEEVEISDLERLLHTFERFLQRKAVMGYHRQVYRNIIQLVRKMITLPPGNEEARLRLEQQIRETHPLAEKNWLLQQLSGNK